MVPRDGRARDSSVNASGSELVLLVCSANICRSPLAELLLLRGLGDSPGVRIESAGVRARTGSAMCALAAEQLAEGGRADGAASHRSRPLTTELLDEATLILATARDVRSEVVGLAPQVRDRVYTMREAAYLGEGFAPETSARRVGVVSLYAMHLDGARAVKGPLPRRRSGWWPMRGADGRDIVDGHVHGPREHRRTLRDVVEASTAILEQLGGRAIR
ncbi:MAG: hypothetical protein ACTIA5_07600 [Brachybacterium tyrofermentans]